MGTAGPLPMEAMIQLADALELSLGDLLAELPPTWSGEPTGAVGRRLSTGRSACGCWPVSRSDASPSRPPTAR